MTGRRHGTMLALCLLATLAAPALAQTQKRTPPPPPPAPAVKIEPAPPPPLPKPPDIALEQEKRKQAQAQRKQEELERQKKIEARKKQEELQKRELAEKKAADEKKRQEEQVKAAKAKALQQEEAKRLEAMRQENLRRMQGLAGATGRPDSTGAAEHSSGPSDSYAGRIQARVRPQIVFTDEISGNPVASVEVQMAPDGTIVSRRLVKSSGVRSWDAAVLRALDKTEVLPRDVDGRIHTPLIIDFKPKG